MSLMCPVISLKTVAVVESEYVCILTVSVSVQYAYKVISRIINVYKVDLRINFCKNSSSVIHIIDINSLPRQFSDALGTKNV